jgi:hypothetical protein
MIERMTKQRDSDSPRLNEERAEEVRRLADPNPNTLTLAEFNERLKQRNGVQRRKPW